MREGKKKRFVTHSSDLYKVTEEVTKCFSHWTRYIQMNRFKFWKKLPPEPGSGKGGHLLWLSGVEKREKGQKKEKVYFLYKECTVWFIIVMWTCLTIMHSPTLDENQTQLPSMNRHLIKERFVPPSDPRSDVVQGSFPLLGFPMGDYLAPHLWSKRKLN